jgi:hypothetical protein
METAIDVSGYRPTCATPGFRRKDDTPDTPLLDNRHTFPLPTTRMLGYLDILRRNIASSPENYDYLNA